MAALVPKHTFSIASKQIICAGSTVVPTCHYSAYPRVIENPTTASLKRGTGGRSSFNGIVCTIFGASGFVAPYICNRLGKIGTQLVIPYRGELYKSFPLKLCGDLGQVLFHPFHLKDEESILRCIKYSNVVINLIGKDFETRNFSFHQVHVEGAQRLARLCKQANVKHFIHFSSLNVSPNPQPILSKDGSRFLKSKWEGEQAVRKEFPEATIIRCADIYGQEDRFLNFYQNKRRYVMGELPLWKKGEETEKQPVSIHDVATGVMEIIKNPDTAGKTYQFVGPKRYKLADLVDYFNACTLLFEGHRRVDLKYNLLFQTRVYFSEMFGESYPSGILHWEGIEKEYLSDRVLKNLPTLEDLGVKLTEMESRVYWELKTKQQFETISFRDMLDVPPPPKTVPLQFVETN